MARLRVSNRSRSSIAAARHVHPALNSSCKGAPSQQLLLLPLIAHQEPLTQDPLEYVANLFMNPGSQRGRPAAMNSMQVGPGVGAAVLFFQVRLL